MPTASSAPEYWDTEFCSMISRRSDAMTAHTTPVAIICVGQAMSMRHVLGVIPNTTLSHRDF